MSLQPGRETGCGGGNGPADTTQEGAGGEEAGPGYVISYSIIFKKGCVYCDVNKFLLMRRCNMPAPYGGH